MADYAGTLLDAVSVVVDKKLEQLEYNKTVKAIIIDNAKASKGIYTVKVGSAIFDAYSENKNYVVDDLVYISVLNSNTSDQKIIIGKALAADEENYISTKPFDSFINISDNLITDDISAGLIANHMSDLKQEVLLWSENYYANPLNGYTEIGLQAKFRSWLGSYNIASGNYGLRLDIHSKNKDGEIELYNLYLSNKNMIGNAYNFATFINQQIVFDISTIPNIVYMELSFYQEGGSFFDTDGDMISYEEQITDSLKVDLPKNLFVQDVLLAFGFNTRQLVAGEDYLNLYTGDSTNFAENEVKNIKLHWIHWVNDETTVIMDTNSDLNYEIRWYQYELNAGDPLDTYVNQNWKLLENELNKYEITFITSARNQVEQLQVVIIIDSEELGKQVLYSNIIQFENLYQISQPVLAESGLKLTCLDESEGNYFVYGPGNTLLQPTDANVLRTIRVDFRQGNNSDINIFEDSTVNYNITWSYDTENAMFEVVGNPQNTRTLNYRIKDYYSSWQVNNTITCTVTTQENDYTTSTSIDLLFGTGGTSGTDATLVLGFAESTTNAIAVGATAATFKARLYDSSNKIISPTTYNIEWSLEGRDDIELTSGAGNTVELSKESGFSMSDRLILIGTVTNYGDYPLVAKFPIPITADINKYNQMRGISQVVYSTLGYPVAYNIPYSLEPNPNNDEFLWRIVYINNDGNEQYIPAGLDITPPIGVGSISNNNILQPYVMYVKDAYPYSVQAVNPTASEIIYWNQPILVLQNAYPSATLNSWNGKDVVIDEDGGSITAPAIAAGKKNDDNTFSGIMLGDWSSQNTDGSISSMTGIYGLDSGIMSYAFKEDGTAFIGKSGIGRINFDGNHGWITSGDFELSDDETAVHPSTGETIRYYTGTSFIDLTGQGEYILRGNNIWTLIVKFGNNFIITPGGNVYISGDLTATRLTATQSGQIGSFNINSTWLYSVAQDQKSSIYLGSQGIYLGLDLTLTNPQLANSPFYVTQTGYLKAAKGTIAGWNISATSLYKLKNNAVFFKLDSSDASGAAEEIKIKLGNNFAVGSNGSVNLKNLLLLGNLEVRGRINGFYKIVVQNFTYTIKRNNYYYSRTGYIPTAQLQVNGATEYIPAGVIRAMTGNKWVKLVGINIDTSGKWTLQLSKHPRTQKVTATAQMTFLLLKSNYCTVARLNALNDDNSDSDIAGDGNNSIVGAGSGTGSLSIVDLDGTEYIDTGDTGDPEGAGTASAANENEAYVIGGINDNLNISDYAKLNSPAFTGVPTAPDINNATVSSQIATKGYIDNLVAGFTYLGPGSLNNYATKSYVDERNSPTNTQLKNKINAIIREANLSVDEFD